MLPNIDLNIYKYDLPNERIAMFPKENRDECKLLKVNRETGTISHHKFSEIPHLLPLNSEMFINTSKVISARISAQKSTSGKAEIFMVEPLTPFPEYNLALSVRTISTWKCIIGGKNIKAGDILYAEAPIANCRFEFRILTKEDNNATVEFDLTNYNMSVADFLEHFGKIPLPPYIKREVTDNDKITYQTVYANALGSVAAPTAGLHFTKKMLKKLLASGIAINELVLHVGLGTFKPIATDDINQHDMHSERIIINKSTLEHLIVCLELNKNIVSVGTTTTRTLESIYWLGVRLIENPNLEIDFTSHVVTPDEPYKTREEVSPIDSIKAVNEYFDKHEILTLVAYTKLFIVPGYRYRLVNILITNFHQPESTLILLVAALLGTELWKQGYNAALADPDYRFLSYGDACLFFNNIKG